MSFQIIELSYCQISNMAIEWASSRNRDRLSGQGNLFDSKEEFST